jgi:type IV secretory pathway TrbD component
MGFETFKRNIAVRVGVVAGAFMAGMVVEATGGYSAWGVGLVLLFVGLGFVALLHGADPWLERLYERSERRRAQEWPEF